MNANLNKLLKMSLLCALSIVMIAFVRFPLFPQAPYLIFDIADTPLLIGTFLYGPVSGLLMTIVVSALQALFFSADGIVGFLMHVIASGALVLTAGLIYHHKKTKKSAFIGLLAGTIAMVAVMIPSNLIFTVNFYGTPYDVVVAALPITILFNFIKAAVNSLIVFLVYKPLKKLFHQENALHAQHTEK